jgi:hypothetical protein
MIEPPSSEEFESPEAPRGEDREPGFGRRILYAVPMVLGKLALGMLIPIVLVIILAFLAQKVIGH